MSAPVFSLSNPVICMASTPQGILFSSFLNKAAHPHGASPQCTCGVSKHEQDGHSELTSACIRKYQRKPLQPA